MLIIGCDLHTRYQEIAMLDTASGEVARRRLKHENGEARAFFANLTERAQAGGAYIESNVAITQVRNISAWQTKRS